MAVSITVPAAKITVPSPSDTDFAALVARVTAAEKNIAAIQSTLTSATAELAKLEAAAPAPAPAPAPTPAPTGLTAPAQAAAAGYHTLAFDDEFDTNSVSSTDDITGFKWVSPVSNPNGPQNVGSRSIASSVLTLSDLQNLYSVSADSTGGFSIPKTGAYIEAMIAIDPNAHGDAAFWSMSRQWLGSWSGKMPGAWDWPGAPSGWVDFCELDFMEYFPDQNSPRYQATIHEWYGPFVNGMFSNVANQTPSSDGTDGGTTWHNNTIQFPAGYDVTKFHKYGCLYIPSVNGSQGSVQFFLDDQPTADKVTWVGPRPNYSGTNPGNTPWTFSIIDQHDQFLILGAPTGSMHVDWIRVWAKP